MKSEHRRSAATPSPERPEMGLPVPMPTIALAAHWHTFPDRLDWALAHRFAVEYAPNPGAFHLLPVHLGPALQAGVPVRHHAFFPQFEMGNRDPAAADRALRVHRAAVEAIHGWGEQVLTVHIGLDRQIPISGRQAVENLARLVDHAQRLGITVALENLRRGPTSDPETVVEWACRSGAMVTLDVGHAISCERVARGDASPLDFIGMFAGRLIEAHVYEREAERHYPPHDMSILGPVVDGLLAAGCAWWTIELNEPDEALATRTLLLDYLRTKRDAP